MSSPKITKRIKCLECGVFTQNSDYCSNCGNLISYQKKTTIKAEKAQQKELKEIQQKEENSLPERLKKHPFFLYQIFGYVFQSVFWVVSIIGGFVAWFLAMVAAG